jgi:hypothetical protein
MAENISYDYQAPSQSVYLRLKSNGESCKIRIVSDPVKFQSEYQGKIAEKYAWLVIDRVDQTIKVFQCGKDIWKKVSAFAKNPDWGNPQEYDITILRTGISPSNFYDVAPSPAGKGPISEDEMAMVLACPINLMQAVEKKKE